MSLSNKQVVTFTCPSFFEIYGEQDFEILLRIVRIAKRLFFHLQPELIVGWSIDLLAFLLLPHDPEALCLI